MPKWSHCRSKFTLKIFFLLPQRSRKCRSTLKLYFFGGKKPGSGFQNVIFETNLDDQMKPKVVVDDNSEVERGYNEKKHSTNGWTMMGSLISGSRLIGLLTGREINSPTSWFHFNLSRLVPTVGELWRHREYSSQNWIKLLRSLKRVQNKPVKPN